MMPLKKDAETGEALTKLNSETGEEEFPFASPPSRNKPKVFKIPPSYYSEKNKQKPEQSPQGSRGSHTFATAILYLLPATLFFNPVLSFVTIAFEAMIHAWTHKKNKSLKNKNLVYRSPLHIIVKEFCGACREEESKMKITKFQEKRADKLIKKYGLDYVRRIVT